MKSNYLISGSQDTNVKVWDLRSKKSVYTLKPHPKPITCVDISKDARVYATGSADSVKIWDSGKQAFNLRNSESNVTALALNPVDVALVAGHSDRYNRYWDLYNGSMV